MCLDLLLFQHLSILLCWRKWRCRCGRMRPARGH